MPADAQRRRADAPAAAREGWVLAGGALAIVLLTAAAVLALWRAR